MRHLSRFFKSLFNHASALLRRARGADTRHASHIGPSDRRDAESASTRPRTEVGPEQAPVPLTKRGSTKWWGGVAAWGIHGNEEFTKWWNHWMSRIPHTGSGLSPNRARKNDV